MCSPCRPKRHDSKDVVGRFLLSDLLLILMSAPERVKGFLLCPRTPSVFFSNLCFWCAPVVTGICRERGGESNLLRRRCPPFGSRSVCMLGLA